MSGSEEICVLIQGGRIFSEKIMSNCKERSLSDDWEGGSVFFKKKGI